MSIIVKYGDTETKHNSYIDFINQLGINDTDIEIFNSSEINIDQLKYKKYIPLMKNYIMLRSKSDKYDIYKVNVDLGNFWNDVDYELMYSFKIIKSENLIYSTKDALYESNQKLSSNIDKLINNKISVDGLSGRTVLYIWGKLLNKTFHTKNINDENIVKVKMLSFLINNLSLINDSNKLNILSVADGIRNLNNDAITSVQIDLINEYNIRKINL